MDVTSAINPILWIILGAIAGWIASMITGDDAQQGWLGNIVVGIVGSLIGGLILSFIQGGGPFPVQFNLISLIAAVLGSVILLWILRLFGAR